MAVNVHENYVISGEAIATFNRSYGDYTTFRNAFIKISEHDVLFRKELLNTVLQSDLEPHFDSVNSLAIGYGFDLLVRSDAEINTYLVAAGIATLSSDDSSALSDARALREFVRNNLSDSVRSAHLDQLAGEINQNNPSAIVFATDASASSKLRVVMDYYAGSLSLRLGSIQDANEILTRFLNNTLETRVSLNSLPESKERAAVLSTLYQLPGSPTLIGLANGTVQNSDDNTRAKIWLEIRYFSGDGYQARRNRESDMFGLYDTPNGEFGGGNDEILKIADYLFRGKRYSSSGSSSEVYSSIKNDSAALLQDLKQSISPALIKLSSEYADGATLDAAYKLSAEEVSLDVSGLASSGKDLLMGNSKSNELRVGEDNDVVYGDSGNDTIYGEAGDDTLHGGNDADTIYGGSDQDNIFGDDGEDCLDGGSGNDILDGGDKRDTLAGGAGADELRGGGDEDIYIVDGEDTILDSDGKGKVFLGSVQLTGGERTDDDPENTYFGGGNKYFLDGSTLIINDGLTIKNYSKGESSLQIVLLDKEEEEEEEETDEVPNTDEAASRTSPIIIDLDGDGVETQKLGTTYFDFNGDGLKELTGWAGADDGILVSDLDGDGKISTGAELFGNHTLLSNGQTAVNGFQALAEYDDNDDGIIDANDSSFNKLSVWRDFNSNGVTDAGELKSLAEAGVVSISTDYDNSSQTDGFGHEHRQTSSVILSNGTASTAADVWFKIDTARRVNSGSIELSLDIYSMPNARGFGKVHDLYQAMALDPQLKVLLNAFLAATNPTLKSTALDNLIYRWTGSENVDPYSRDPSKIYAHVMDARQLVTLENLVGHSYLGTWCWGERDPNPHGQAAPILVAEYLEFKRYTAAQLLAQTEYAQEFDFIRSAFGSDATNFAADWSKFESKLTALLATNQTERVRNIVAVADDLGVYSPDYRAQKSAAYQTILLHSPALAQYLIVSSLSGSSQADSLVGREDGTILSGLGGNDYLQGQKNSDVYRFNRGDGNDTIYDKGGVDYIVFGEGVTSSNLVFTRNATSLKIDVVIQGSNFGSVFIQNFFDFDNSISHGAIEGIEFSDGTSFSLQQILDVLTANSITNGNDVVYGSNAGDSIFVLNGNDVAYGFNGNDTIDGGGGNDILYGDAGNDTLIGGSGNDTLNGGLGNDTFIFSLGDGNDVVESIDDGLNKIDRILFSADVDPTAVTLEHSGNDLVIRISVYSSVRIKDHFSADSTRKYAIQEVVFYNGTVWTADTLKDLLLQGNANDNLINGFLSDDIVNGQDGNDTVYAAEGDDTIYGGAGDDILSGGSGNDVLDGGAGNDWLAGGDGSDIYRFGYGAGADVIDNYRQWDPRPQSIDAVVFDADIDEVDVVYSRSNDDLIVKLSGSEDSLRVSGFFLYYAKKYTHDVQEFRFASGRVISSEEIRSIVLIPTGGDDRLIGYFDSDNLSGGAGSDYISGNEGNDTLDGGDGNDVLAGGDGDNYLIGGAGNDQITGWPGTNYIDPGSGNDVIYNSGQSTIVFGKGYGTDSADLAKISIRPDTQKDDLRYIRAVDDLVIVSKSDLADRIVVRKYFSTDSYYSGQRSQYFSIDFSSGESITDLAQGLMSGVQLDLSGGGYGLSQAYSTSKSYSALADVMGQYGSLQNLGYFIGGSNIGDDILLGSHLQDEMEGRGGNDYLDGRAGNDTLDGGNGDDTFVGGTGDDFLYLYLSEYGKKTIVYNYGDGKDRITQGGASSTIIINGYAFEEVGFRRSEWSLYMDMSDGGSIRLYDFFDYSGAYQVSSNYPDTNIIIGASIITAQQAKELAHAADKPPVANADYVTGRSNAPLIIGTNELLGNDSDQETAYLYVTAIGGAPLGGAYLDVDGATILFVPNNGFYGTTSFTYTVSDGIKTAESTVAIEIFRSYDVAASQSINISSSELLASPDDFGLSVIGVADWSGGTAEFDSQSGNITFIAESDVGDGWVDYVVSDGTNTFIRSFDITIGTNQNLTLAGTNSYDTIEGSLGNDTLNGGGSSDYLFGNAGNDRLNGGSGADWMVGGLGDDTYVVDNVSDLAIETVNGGIDTVESSVSITLSSNIENLLLTGSSGTSGTGNELNNVLTGNSGANLLIGGLGNDRLDGKAGSDTMQGGIGNDVYVVERATDVVVEDSGAGIDTVEASITYTLGENVENLTLTGSSTLTGTGNSLDNIIIGNGVNNTLVGGGGNDRLDGGLGNDTMRGGVGNDTYVVNATTDVVTENANEGIDTIESTVALTLSNNVENLLLTGGAAINGTGNTLDNTLTGNSGTNSLQGLAGNDILDGREGNDSLTGGVGNDSYLFGRGYGADTIIENDATSGNLDAVNFLSGIRADQLWFSKASGSNNLDVSVIGTSDKLVIKDWYLGSAYHVEQMRTADGKTLIDSKVQNLVNAMASFSPPVAGQTELPSNYHTALDSVIAANWQ